MRTLNRFVFLFLGILHILHPLFGQEVLTLEECLSRARAANPDVRQIALTQTQLDVQQKIVSLNRLPQLSLNGKATWQSDVTAIPIEIPGMHIPRPDQDQYAATLDLSQSLYDGGATSARRNLLEQEALVSHLKYQSGIQTTDDIVTDLFFQILLQQQLINTSELLISQLTNTIQRLEDLHASGVITNKDVLSARVKLSEAEQKLQEAKSYKEMFTASLARQMGQDDADFEIVSYDQVLDEDGLERFSQRAEMQLIGAKAKVVEAAEQLSRAQYHPRVSAFASLGYGKPGLNFLSNTFDTYAIAGVNVSIPLSQFYSGKASRESQVFQLQKASLQLAQEKHLRDLNIKAEQHMTEMAKLESWLLEDDRMITMRREMLDVSTAQHEGGTITTTDYLNEITELSLAEERRTIHAVMLQRESALLYNLYGLRTSITQ